MNGPTWVSVMKPILNPASPGWSAGTGIETRSSTGLYGLTYRAAYASNRVRPAAAAPPSAPPIRNERRLMARPVGVMGRSSASYAVDNCTGDESYGEQSAEAEMKSGSFAEQPVQIGRAGRRVGEPGQCECNRQAERHEQQRPEPRLGHNQHHDRKIR